MKRFIILFFITCLSFSVNAQYSTIQLTLQDEVSKKPIKECNVKVIINDTIVRQLVTDEKGITGFIELSDGKYTLAILVEPYNNYVLKNLAVGGAKGKHIKVKLSKKI